MKNFKLLLAALVFSAFTANAQAQERPKRTEEQKKEHQEQRQENKKRLALTPDQESAFEAINKKYGPEMKALKKSESSRDEKFKKMKEMRERKDNEVKGILSETQYQTYVAMQKERKQKMKEKRKDRIKE